MVWKKFRHNGVAFPKSYEAKKVLLKIKGKKVEVNSETEEMAYAWVKKIGTPYVEDPIFISNFLRDFTKKIMYKNEVESINEIDFSNFNKILERERKDKENKDLKKKLSEKRKIEREKLKDEFGYAEVDDQNYEVSNWMVEPPGLFMGRGKHPLRGRWKPRTRKSEVTLNLDQKAKVPEGEWEKIVHDPESMWIAKWKDQLTNKVKYVWLSDSSTIKQDREKRKYDLARKLGKNIFKVREKIKIDLKSEDVKIRKIAMICYFIDKLAMRVGDEKDSNEADTVGASTLRVEHIKVSGEGITFDFLGKDSVRWERTFKLKDKEIKETIKNFLGGKEDHQQIFDGVNSKSVNKYLSEIMEGLSAKVFRTYIATTVVKKYLQSIDVSNGLEMEKKFHIKMANLEAAKICNHKRAIPKNWDEKLVIKKEKLKILRKTEVKTEKQTLKLEERINKLKIDIKFTEESRDHNLGTSLKNYIDPRVCVVWAKDIGLDWEKIYTKTLQRKFLWASKTDLTWKNIIVKF